MIRAEPDSAQERRYVDIIPKGMCFSLFLVYRCIYMYNHKVLNFTRSCNKQLIRYYHKPDVSSGRQGCSHHMLIYILS